MAITVNLRYLGKNGAARAFAEEMISSGTVDKIRAETGGCVSVWQPALFFAVITKQ